MYEPADCWVMMLVREVVVVEYFGYVKEMAFRASLGGDDGLKILSAAYAFYQIAYAEVLIISVMIRIADRNLL